MIPIENLLISVLLVDNKVEIYNNMIIIAISIIRYRYLPNIFIYAVSCSC